MPVIAAPVITFVTGVTGSVTIGALAGAVAVGVVSGAVVGAASAAISGGDIFEGALKGAAYGGISGGVLSGLGMATGLMSAQSQLAQYGLAPTGVSAGISQSTNIPSLIKTGTEAQSIMQASGGLLTKAQPIASAGTGITSAVTSTSAKSLLTDKTTEILAGIGQGIASGYGEVEAAKETEKAKREFAEWKQKVNIPAVLEQRTANITIPDYWKSYTQNYLPTQTNAAQPTTGLLSQATI